MEQQHKFSFEKGFYQIPYGKAKECRKKIMDGLGIDSRGAFLKRLRGEVEPKVSEKEAIENVIASYGVNKNQIWGKD